MPDLPREWGAAEFSSPSPRKLRCTWPGQLPAIRDFAILSDEAQAKFQRVGAGRSSEFIHKRFNHEAAGGMLDGAPPGARHGRFCERVFDTVVRSLIRNERGGGKFGLFRI